MGRVRIAVLLLVPALLLAGCASSPAPAAPVEDAPGIITDPTMGLNQTGAHIHDYWKGLDRLVIIGDGAAGDETGLGPGFASGNDIPVRMFQPASGHVVPQGTARVEVTFAWTDASDGLDMYGSPTVYVKTAANNATQLLGATENGQTLMLETDLPAADLPHQSLSAWAFELRMSAAPDTGVLRFKGEVQVQVEAVRGLDLPVFPAHPDPWKGANELPLLNGTGQLAYFEDLGDGGCNGMACPVVFTPTSGAIVPGNASLVRVTVTYTGPLAPELRYHGSDSRTMAAPGSFTGQPGLLIYDLPVEKNGDGPYASQSQWEFTVVPSAAGPLRTGWFVDYTITATAVQ